jgi:tetratricopeptide (TPR) repeat protein
MPISRFVYDPWELPPEQRQTTFVGRQPVLDRFVGAIREQEDRATVQHYILTGPRGIGKTTLLLVLRDRIRQDPELSAKWFCVQLREEEYYVHKQRDLWQLVLQALAVDEKLAEAQKVVNQAQEIADEEKSSALLVDGLRSICNRHGKRLVLLIDNFDHIFPSTAAGEAKHRKPDSEYKAFRKRLSTETFLMLIAASVKLFQDIYGYDEGFFHFFSPIELPELSREEVAEMLHRLGETENNTEFLARLERSRVSIHTLTFLTGGNPRLITMLYHILSQREIGEPVQALWETVAGLTPMLRQDLADMPRQQSKTLDALLRLNGAAAPAEISKYSRLPLNVVTTQLGRLKGARYVALEGGGKGKKATYRVADQMFSVWYRMRYVPAARRRIELFVDFVRAWFSPEERRHLFMEGWDRYHTYQSRGFIGLAGQTLRNVEYIAASLDDPTERRSEMERVADAYISVGDSRAAAGLFAELAGSNVKSMAKFESLGYSVLAKRLAQKGDLETALTSYSEALAKDPNNAQKRTDLGVCLGQIGRHAEAKEQFGEVLKGLGLNAVLRSQVLFNRAVARSHLGDPQGEIADYTTLVELPGAPLRFLVFAFVNRAITKIQVGDPEGAIADCTAAVDLKDAPAEQVATALVNRGIAKGQLGDSHGAIADYTAVVELKGARAEAVASALVNRGVTKGQLGDTQGEIADYTALVELKGAPSELVASALFNRGATKGQLGDPQGAIADYTALVELNGAPAEQVAKALVYRGVTQGQLGDPQGAIADYGAAVELEGAPAEQVASALFNRGVTKGQLGDPQGAIADYGATVELEGAPAEQVASALFNRGATKGQLGDPQGAIVDYTALVELNGAPAEQVANALVNRGATKGQLGDLQGAIADYTALVELKGAPAGHVAMALINRGVAKGQLGDPQGAIADCTMVVELKGAPAEQVAQALVNRGVNKGQLGHPEGAIADYTAALEPAGVPAEQEANALFNRGFAKGQVGDPQGAIADYTAVVELKGARTEQVAKALINRGVTKGQLGDPQGEIADYTGVIELKGAPAQVLAGALVLRGTLYGKLGQHEQALRDFSLSLEVPSFPENLRIPTIFNRGMAHEKTGKPEEALLDYARCARSGILRYIHIGLQSMVRLLLSGKRVDEALGWVRRFHELEPQEAPLDARLQARLAMIVVAARAASLENASHLVKALLESDPEELRARLQFLKPGLELAKTHDESVLANLPEDERKIAREIARSLAESARPPVAQPPS